MPISPKIPKHKSPDSTSTNASLYDFNSIISVAGGEPKIIKGLIDGLIQSNRNDLTELDALLEAEDLPGLAEIAHRFKGPAKIINSQPLLQSCKALEEAAHAAQISVVKERAQSLRALVLRMEEALQEQSPIPDGGLSQHS